jgi:hypothetical protein
MSFTITVKFEIQNNTRTPMELAKYVKASAENPTTIEEGGTATLHFVADGVYYKLLKARALAAKVSGASYSWTSVSPHTNGELTLSNPSDNVEVIIKVTTNIVPQNVENPFTLKKSSPVDTRLVLTKEEMKTANDNYLPPVYFASCLDDGKFYLYNKSNDSNEETGKYKQLVTEGITDLDRLDEEDITDILNNLNLD